MFTCRACTRRCLQALIGDSSIHATPSQLILPQRQLYRSFNTVATEADAYNYLPPVAQDEGPSNAIGSRTEKRQEWLDSRGQRPADKPAAPIDPRIDNKFIWMLKQLQDPLQLANYVRKLLSDDDFEKALLYVRSASKNVECVVSWNHLIEWQFSRGRLPLALKTYNEMKKRAQFPDAQTYTIIFKGCSESPAIKIAFEKGLAIYTSMLSARSRVKPNTIHMNAVLRLCSRAGEEEALLGIAAQMPSEGPGAPDNFTFTTILNALRMKIIQNRDMSAKEALESKRKLIDNAHRIWGDVYTRWRKGDIMVDEELVCAMGRTLLLGSEEDNDDVLSLVEQTMNVRRQVPRRGTKSRQRIEPSLQGKSMSKKDNLGLIKVEGGDEVAPKNQPENIFTNAGTALASSPKLHVYATPGPNTISMVLSALTNMAKKDPATKYWQIFTKELGLVPDADNYLKHIRILRLFRSSREVLELLLEIPREKLKPEFFRYAMGACERDKKNPNVFVTAGKILDIMQMNLEIPDVEATVAYLDLAISSSLTRNESGNRPTKYEQGKQISRALERVGPSYLNIRSLVMYGNPTATDFDRYGDGAFKAQALVLIRRIIGAYDYLMDKGLVSRELYTNIYERRNKLVAYELRAARQERTSSHRYREPNPKQEPEQEPEQEREREPDFEVKEKEHDKLIDRRTHEFTKRQFKVAVKEGLAPFAATQGFVARVQPFANRRSNIEMGRPASFANRKAETSSFDRKTDGRHTLERNGSQQ